MSSLQFQIGDDHNRPQQIFSVLYSLSQLSNLAVLFFLPGLLLFKITFSLVLIIGFLRSFNQRMSIFHKMLDLLGILELMSIFTDSNLKTINFTRQSVEAIMKLFSKSILPFVSLFICFVDISSSESLSENSRYLLIFTLLLNATILSCYYQILQQGENHNYDIDAHISLLLQIISHVGMICLFCIRFQSDTIVTKILAIRLISFSIQAVIIIMNKQHPYRLNANILSILGEQFMRNLMFYPQNYGPYFKLGYYKNGLIEYNDTDEITRIHTYQQLVFLRAAIFGELIVFAWLNCSSGYPSSIIIGLIFAFVYLVFLAYAIITVKYLLQVLNQYKNGVFEYLTLFNASPKQINQLISKPGSINYLNVLEISPQQNEEQPQRSRYIMLPNEMTQQQLLIQKLFSFIYEEEPLTFEQRIKIGNIFSLQGKTIQLSSQEFLLQFLDHIKQSQTPQKRKIVFGGISKKQFNYRLNQALFERLFEVGFDRHFFKHDYDNFSSLSITKQYISLQCNLAAFEKLIKPNMLMSPHQILFDLYEQ